MGANESQQRRKSGEEENQKKIEQILDQQRKMYEDKCNEMLKKQKKTIIVHAEDAINFHRNVLQNSSGATCRPVNSNAQLYPSFDGIHENVNMQCSTSSAFYNMSNINNNRMNATTTPVQHKPIGGTTYNCSPSAPTAPPSNEASVSTPSTMKHSGTQRVHPRDQKNEIWKCITCNNSCNTKIFQCQQGHSSCSTCKLTGAKCGICKKLITDTRNITLENFIAENQSNMVPKTAAISCPNQIDGCRLRVKPHNVEAHLKECPFREMACPLAFTSGCLWRGKINQLQSHCLDCHPNQAGPADVATELTFDCNSPNYVIHHIVLGNFNFLVHLNLQSTMVYMTVQLVGSRLSASKWIYELHIYKKSEPRRKYTYVDICKSNSTAFPDICYQSNCAMLPLQYAKSFLTDGKMMYKIYIKKESDIEL